MLFAFKKIMQRKNPQRICDESEKSFLKDIFCSIFINFICSGGWKWCGREYKKASSAKTHGQPRADVPTLATGTSSLKETGDFQTMPNHDEEKCRAYGKENRRQRNAAMQFVHAAYPLRQTPRPEQNGEEEWSERDQRPPRNIKLSYPVRKKEIAGTGK